MKGLIWIIVLFAAAVGLTIVAQHYSGNVYIVIDQTQTQIAVNLHLFVGAMIVFVVLLYLLLRLINGIINIPGRVRRCGRGRQAHHAETALNKAGLAYFEGKFQHAEQEAAKVLENKEAGHNRTLALMLAVHSADQMGDDAKREGYLKEIAQLPHKAQLSRHLLEAESALNRQDYPAAEAAWAAAAVSRSGEPAPILMVPGAGHAPMLEHSGAVGPRIVDFARSVSAPADDNRG